MLGGAPMGGGGLGANGTAPVSRSLLLGVLLFVLFLSASNDASAHAGGAAGRRGGATGARTAFAGRTTAGNEAAAEKGMPASFRETLKEKLILDLSRANEALERDLRKERVTSMMLAAALRDAAGDNATVAQLVKEVTDRPKSDTVQTTLSSGGGGSSGGSGGGSSSRAGGGGGGGAGALLRGGGASATV